MSINLLKEFTESISGDLMSKASSFLGEDSSAIKKGLSAAAPALLGSLVKTGSSRSGAETIMNLLKSGGFDGSLLGNAASLLGDQSNAMACSVRDLDCYLHCWEIIWRA